MITASSVQFGAVYKAPIQNLAQVDVNKVIDQFEQARQKAYGKDPVDIYYVVLENQQGVVYGFSRPETQKFSRNQNGALTNKAYDEALQVIRTTPANQQKPVNVVFQPIDHWGGEPTSDRFELVFHVTQSGNSIAMQSMSRTLGGENTGKQMLRDFKLPDLHQTFEPLNRWVEQSQQTVQTFQNDVKQRGYFGRIIRSFFGIFGSVLNFLASFWPWHKPKS